MTSRPNLIGQKFNRLTVLEFDSIRQRNSYWKCVCDCGKESIVAACALKSSGIKSCGCLKLESSMKTVKYAQRAKKLPDGVAEFNTIYSRYKQQSIFRNINFNISKTEFESIINQNCFYCGRLPKQIARSHSKHTTPYLYNGIDRIDNNSDYNLDNCVPCCKICNRAKREMDYNDFLDWIRDIVNHNKERDI